MPLYGQAGRTAQFFEEIIRLTFFENDFTQRRGEHGEIKRGK
jgi:hypothetical protein